MELRVVEREERALRVEVVNPDDTVIYPLIRRLLEDERVEDARYQTGHPFLDKPQIHIRVREDPPAAVLKEVAEALSTLYGEVRAKVEEALKGVS